MCLLMLVIAAAGCAGAAQKPVPLNRWLSFSAAHKSVNLRLSPGGDSVSSYNFDGYKRGEVLVQVPRNWRVVVHCLNRASSSHHSCAIVQGTESTVPAFPGAATPNPQVGLAPGSSASFSFLASRPGAYRIACLVPNHELNGMWNVFQVGGAPRPSVTLLRSYP